MLSIASRVLSLAIAIGYATALVIAQHAVTFALIALCGVLIFPLAMIWFPDEMGSVTGNIGRGSYATQESPGALVTCLGWTLLVGVPIAWYFIMH
jgi:hypothetical protein